MAVMNSVLTLRADQGETYQVGDTSMNFIVRAEQTTSQIAVHEWTVAPGALGAPPHIHTRDDEVFYVLAGELTVMEDGAVTTAPAGTYVVLPRGRVHCYWNAGDVPVRALVILTPGQLEGFLAGASALKALPGSPDAAELDRLAQEYGLELRMDLVPALMAEHGLTSIVAPPPGSNDQ